MEELYSLRQLYKGKPVMQTVQDNSCYNIQILVEDPKVGQSGLSWRGRNKIQKGFQL